jgi:Ca-activated chloride channel homolog
MKLLYAIPTSLFLIGTAIAQCTFAKTPTSATPIVNPSVETQKLLAGNMDNSEQDKNSVVGQKNKEPGGLFFKTKDGKQQVFPLKHTEVKAKISGNISRVEVTQTFENPLTDPLEAIYVFPLPDQSAVDDMEIKIGDRTIKGLIKKREEAQKIYEQAKKEGRTAGLLEQERDNIFTQSLANIKPGEKIEVTIRYSDSLKFEKGNYEFVFPMVVGPRYIGGNPIPNTKDSDRVPDASRITPPVMKPGTRSGHDINVTVEINAGIPISKITSTSHKINVDNQGQTAIVKLENGDNIPNKDLILRYQVSSAQTEATVLTQSDEKGGHFAVYLIPAVKYNPKEIVPKDVVFLMDTSGSQSGDPILKSQELMRRFINGLNPDDTFTIINFANSTEKLSSSPLRNTPANRQKAIDYINKLDANGGTELLNGIQEVLKFPSSEDGRLRSVVLITDGYIGDDNSVIAEVQSKLKTGNRLYSFGVGSSVNRYLLDRLGEVGRGTSQVIRQDEPSGEVAEKFFRQINNPVLTNIQVTWEGTGEKPEVYPLASPDLFANQPLVLFGKKKDRQNGRLKITGIAAGGQGYEKTINVNFDQTGNEAIAQLWGRAKIKDLMNLMYGNETKTGVEAVTNTALEYKLLSQYTAFVAVSEEVRVNPEGKKQTVQVPVELPQGVSYEGIFGNDEKMISGNINAVPAAPASIMQSSRRRMQSSGGRSRGPVPLSAPKRTSGGGTRGGNASESDSMSIPEIKTKKDSNQPVAKLQYNIEVISADGLDSTAIQALQQHLQNVTLTSTTKGEIVLELVLSKGRVNRVVFDDQVSTIKEQEIIEIIKRSLLTWQPDGSINATVRVKLRIN